MKNNILYFLLLSTLVGCLTTKKQQIVDAEEIKESILRVNPKDTAAFELIFVNNLDEKVIMGDHYGAYAMEFEIYNDKGEQINEINGMSSERSIIDPGGRIVVSEFIVTIIQMALENAKLDKQTFGKYTLVWKPPHIRSRPAFKNFSLSLEVTYDQGDIDYLREFKNREMEAYKKSKLKKSKNN